MQCLHEAAATFFLQSKHIGTAGRVDGDAPRVDRLASMRSCRPLRGGVTNRGSSVVGSITDFAVDMALERPDTERPDGRFIDAAIARGRIADMGRFLLPAAR